MSSTSHLRNLVMCLRSPHRSPLPIEDTPRKSKSKEETLAPVTVDGPPVQHYHFPRTVKPERQDVCQSRDITVENILHTSYTVPLVPPFLGPVLTSSVGLLSLITTVVTATSFRLQEVHKVSTVGVVSLPSAVASIGTQ